MRLSSAPVGTPGLSTGFRTDSASGAPRIRYPPAMWRACSLFLLCFLSACPRAAKPLIPTPKQDKPVSAAEIAKLQIPPTEESLEVFRDLEGRADAGDVQAAWQRAHFLLDLFDAARFADDQASRTMLSEIAGRPKSAMQGSAATQAVSELVLLEVDHVLEIERGHTLAQQAQTLIRFDALPPQRRSEVFQRVEELKRVVAKESQLSTAARLRLFGYCRQALSDARALIGSRQRIALSHCLYPLYSSDPSPYFADKASLRPPPPELAEILVDLKGLLTDSAPGRLDAAVATQSAWIEEFKAAVPGFQSHDPVKLRLPPATGVTPYDDYPLLGSTGGSVGEEAGRLRGPLLADARKVLGLAFASEAPAATTIKAAQIAAEAGAQGLAVLVSMQQRLSVPKGDYGSSRLQGDSVTRAGEMHWSLALIDGSDAAPDGASAKATGWDPRRAALRLHLLVSPKSWRLTSPSGDLATIDTSTKEKHPQKALRAELAALRRAFPDEDGLVLVPDDKTSHGALVAAALAARRDADGQPLFSRLAIAASAPKKRSGKALRRRIQKRAAAVVNVSPKSLEARIPVARRCYLELLDTGAAPKGEIRMERGADGKVKLSKKGALAECAEKAFLALMQEQKTASVAVRFSVQGK